MPTLSDLPPELLQQIYHYLGSIDDVHHLGRACRSTYHVIKRPTVYTEIMRSIIAHSHQHRFDISLCRMLDLHRDIVQHFTKGGAPIPPTQLNPHGPLNFHPLETQLVSAITIDCVHGPCTQCLPDGRIHEILARFQGLRILEDQWLARPLTDDDLLSVNCSSDEDELVRMYDVVIERDQEFRDSSSHSNANPENFFNTDQRSRFYSATTATWLLNEVRWVLTNFVFPAPGFALQIRLLEVCQQWIAKQSETPMLEELDRYAIFRFQYHHLLPVYGSFLADRCSSKLPLAYSSQLEKSPIQCTRILQLFLLAGQTYLQPPDLIDLIVRNRVSRKPPYPLLDLPFSTESWQRPCRAYRFLPGLDYTTSNPPIIGLMNNAITYLNIINRATINQTETHPQRNWTPQQHPEPTSLFKVQDDSATWYKEKALTQFDMGAKRSGRKEKDKLEDVRKVFRRDWPETWWQVWWWASSEEKARAKMERWREMKPE